MSDSSSPSPSHLEWQRLFAAKADGTISPAEHEQLTVLLKESPEARREWFAFQDAESALLAWAQREAVLRSVAPQGGATEAAIVARPKPTPGWKLGWREVAVLVVFVSVGYLTWPRPGKLVFPSESNFATSEEATTSAVAVLTRGVDLVWESGADAPSLHEPLSPGELRLKSGVAEIEFFQGARLCIEGPAQLRLVSAGEAYCSSGRFSAEVPPHARGFRIGTPKGDLVDLGTEFGLDLTSATPELHVFKGEVELYQPKTPKRLLTTGQAARMEAGPAPGALPADATAFAFSQDLEARVQASQRVAFDRWQETAAQALRDPNLLLRLDFQDGATARSLRNAAPHGADITAGTIVGCTWTQGRWPGKQALQFRSLSDRVRLNIPGEYRELTLTASVQLHGLNVRQSSLCMSQGIGAGYLHWQVLPDGSLCLGVGDGTRRQPDGAPVQWQDYISPVVFTPERFGRWMHLAMVYDTMGGEVRFYVNGSLLSRHPLKLKAALTPGLVELGNWTPSPDKRQQPVRNFAGCMDEFSAFSRALTGDEILRLAR